MKNTIILFLFSFLFISCSDDSSENLPLTIAPANVEGILTNGTWKVISYEDDNEDETSDFTGYVFTFMSDKTAKAVRNGQTSTGTWNTYKDDKVVKLDINFGDQVPLDEISDDWNITLLTVQKIELEDISGGDGSIDKLTFQKN